MSTLSERMLKLRQSVPQATDVFSETKPLKARSPKDMTPEERAKAKGDNRDAERAFGEMFSAIETQKIPKSYQQVRPSINESLKRIESSEAFGESDPTTGKTDMPGDLGEVAFPQSDRMDAEEALLKKIAGSDESEEVQPTPKPVKAASAVVKESRKRRTQKPKASSTSPMADKIDSMVDDIDEDASSAEETQELLGNMLGQLGQKPTEEEEFNPLVVGEDGIQINEAVEKDHGEELSDNDILDILDQHEKDIRGDMSDEDREEAAGIDYDNDSEDSLPTYTGSGPSGTTVEFYDNPDGGPPKGYMIYPDGSVQVVTGMLFPPGYRQ